MPLGRDGEWAREGSRVGQKASFLSGVTHLGYVHPIQMKRNEPLRCPLFDSLARGLATDPTVQRSKKWLVRGLVKFVTAVARLVCLNLLG